VLGRRKVRKSRRALLVGALVLAGLTAAWWLATRGYFVGGYDVDVQLRFVGGAPDSLADVVLIVGADKFSWGELLPDERVRITMVPGLARPDVTLLFTLHGERIPWRGPELPYGTGYRIALDIDGHGQVEERHCLLPCPPW
jgi:hypothetical protein